MTTQTKSTMKLSVFTLNVWGMPWFLSKSKNVRIKAIAKALSASHYDFVCLQELWLESDYDFLCKSLKKKFPYSHYFISGVTGSGLATFSKWPIINTLFHKWFLNGYPYMVHHGDWFGGKGVGLTQVNINSAIVNVYNTHLIAQYSKTNDIYLTHRVLQAFETANFINMTSNGVSYSLLLGDLNIESDDLAYQCLCDMSRLSDAYSCSPNANKEDILATYSTIKNSFKGINPPIRIDYILFNNSFKYTLECTNYEYGLPSRIPRSELSYSDHEALAADFEVQLSGHTRRLSADYNIYSSSQKPLITNIIQHCKVGKCQVYANTNYYVAVFIMLSLFFLSMPLLDLPLTPWYVILFFLLFIGCLFCFLKFTFWYYIEMRCYSKLHKELLIILESCK